MSFGFGAADLKGVLKLSKWLWDNCFDKDGTADERYRRFGRNIANLRQQIIRLDNVVSSTIDEFDPYDPENAALKREVMEVVGNFIEAIKRCEALLTKHIRLEKDKAGFITNVVWGVKVQEEVDELTRQLQVHAQRLSLVAEPVKYSVLQELRQGVAELVDRARRLDPDLKAQATELVPEWLREVFEANAAVNAPSTARYISNIPVKEGCDLLHRHFSRRHPQDASTDPRSRAAAVRHYLNLLKCQWIVNVLRNTRDFPTYRHGSAFPLFISNVEIQIYQDLQTISRTPRAEVSEQELRALLVESMEPFLIWEPPRIRPVISVTDKKEDEERIATISLACEEGHKEDLLVFKKGTTGFRFVPTQEVDGEVRPSPYLKEERFNLRTDKFFPKYTVDSRGSPRVDFYHDNANTPVTYELKGLRDAWALQRAITGYEVAGSERAVKWGAQTPRLSKLGFGNNSKKELFGCVQIWRWNPPVEAIPSDGSAAARSSSEAPRSPKTSSSAQEKELRSSSEKEIESAAREGGYIASPPNRAPRYSASQKELGSSPPNKEFRYSSSPREFGYLSSPPPSIAPSTTTAFFRENELPRGKHVELQPPVPPVVLFFGHSENTYTCYHLELNSDLFIDRSACPCTATGDGGDCRILVIQHAKGDKFKVRQLSVDDDSAKDWNLAMFRGPGRSAESGDAKSVSSTQCKHLFLIFRTPDERKQFSGDFDFVMGQYDEAAVEYSRYREMLRRGGDRPSGPANNVYNPRSPRSSVVSTLGTSPPAAPSQRPTEGVDPRMSFTDILRRKR